MRRCTTNLIYTYLETKMDLSFLMMKFSGLLLCILVSTKHPSTLSFFGECVSSTLNL